jgi:uncharacterized membrane protein YbhN (UPF0104 family)
VSAPDVTRSDTPSRLAWLSGALLLAVLVFVVVHRTEEEALARLLARAQPIWLLTAVVFQALTYVCAATVWQRALVWHGVAGRPWGLVPLGLAKLFTDQAVPSAGMSGTLLVVRALVRRGIPTGFAVAAMLAGLVAFYVAYAAAVTATLGILWIRGELNRPLLVLATVFCGVAAALPLGALWLSRRARRGVPGWLRRLPGARDLMAALAKAPAGVVSGGAVVLETSALQLAIFLLDAATLAVVLRALAAPVDLPAVFASFVVASAVATLAWVPGGLGTFEGTCVAMLHAHGVRLEVALAATLLLRGFTFWLPMLPGLWLAHREMVGAGPASAASEAR